MKSSAWHTPVAIALVVAFTWESRADSVRLASARGIIAVGAKTTLDEAEWTNKGVWTARLHDHQVLPDTIQRLGPKGTFYQPMMHPKATCVVFWGKEDGTEDFNIWLSGTDGSQCRRLTRDGHSEGPSWSPDGQSILYSSRKNSSYYHIWVMDADGKNQRQLTDGSWNDSRPCMSPDARTLVFASNRSGATNLWRVEASGGPPAQLTRHEGTDFKPCFSPDGGFLAYHTGKAKGSPHNLAVMRWPDGEPRLPVRLKPGEWLHGPFWTRDGRHVLVHGYLMGVSVTRLHLVDINSGQAQLFAVPGFKRWGHGSWDLAETVMAFDGERQEQSPCVVRYYDDAHGQSMTWTPSGTNATTPRKAIPPHAKNCYIADNVVMGVTPWRPSAIHADGKNLGEGIQISGPGNVVCHNKVVGFRDCISIMEGRYAWEQRCIDICNNDIDAGADDGIEVDYIYDNCRIMRNRITNCMRGIAAAPVLEGPAYLIRNVLYNTEGTWQLGRMGSGYVALHNTSVKTGSGVTVESHTHALVCNNLFIAAGGRAQAVDTRGRSRAHCEYDYNGYGVIGGPFAGNLDGVEFHSEQELRSKTTEHHGVQVGLSIFADPVTMPAGLFPELSPADLRLKPGTNAVDAGRVVPNINDDYAGTAPDLGAYETGQPMPIYGPRPETQK